VAKDFTPYQQKIIKNYYENKHPLHLQKLAEMVTELFLSEGKKKGKGLGKGLPIHEGVGSARI